MKSSERFSDRVGDYIQYRPSYPKHLVETLRRECQLDARSLIADIGCGTGKLAQCLLAHDLRVMGVEPNTEMREAALSLLQSHHSFRCVNGSAESTSLPSGSVDLICAAQAFHWFDAVATKREFMRILKPKSHVALIWNQRNLDQAFQREYQELLVQHASDYNKVNHMNIGDDQLTAFFAPHDYQRYQFEYAQRLDLTGFLGRMQSSSYTPKTGSEQHALMVDDAKQLFARYEQDKHIQFEYHTRLYLGRIQD